MIAICQGSTMVVYPWISVKQKLGFDVGSIPILDSNKIITLGELLQYVGSTPTVRKVLDCFVRVRLPIKFHVLSKDM